MDMDYSRKCAIADGWQIDENYTHVLDASRCIWITSALVNEQQQPLLIIGAVQVPLTWEAVAELVKWAERWS